MCPVATLEDVLSYALKTLVDDVAGGAVVEAYPGWPLYQTKPRQQPAPVEVNGPLRDQSLDEALYGRSERVHGAGAGILHPVYLVESLVEVLPLNTSGSEQERDRKLEAVLLSHYGPFPAFIASSSSTATSQILPGSGPIAENSNAATAEPSTLLRTRI